MVNRRELNAKSVVEKIINELSNRNMSIVEISKKLDIKRSTLNYYLQTMEARGIIQRKRIEEKATGRPTIITLKKQFLKKRSDQKEKNKGYFIEMLQGLEKNGGTISFEDFSGLLDLPLGSNDPDMEEKFSAPHRLLYTYPKLVEHMIKITPEGKKFLRENVK